MTSSTPDEVSPVIVKIAITVQVLAFGYQPIGKKWVIAILPQRSGNGLRFWLNRHRFWEVRFFFLLSPSGNPVADDRSGNFAPLLLGFGLEYFGDLVKGITLASEHQNLGFEGQKPARIALRIRRR
uniref:PNL18.2_p2 n=1 Tax=Neisseria lactamica TaxID=486 RepID=Q0QVX2_NEILA|nr:pNL18.2_p2 [Neisseria lactamica]